MSADSKFSTIRQLFLTLLEQAKKVLKTKVQKLKHIFLWLLEALENYLRLTRNNPQSAYRKIIAHLGVTLKEFYHSAWNRFFENYDFETLRILNKIAEKVYKNGFNLLAKQILFRMPSYIQKVDYRLNIKCLNPEGNMKLLDLIVQNLNKIIGGYRKIALETYLCNDFLIFKPKFVDDLTTSVIKTVHKLKFNYPESRVTRLVKILNFNYNAVILPKPIDFAKRIKNF